MKKPSESPGVPDGRKGNAPGPFVEQDTGTADDSGTPNRQDVLQETPRGDVPAQSERPAERGNQLRRRRPG